MDTDSAYMALSAPLETIIKPREKMNFYNNYGQWFPRPYCDQHKSSFLAHKMQDQGEWTREECCNKIYAFDQRTPGLFKDEFVGTGIIALNSKTYFCWSEGDNCKYSSKGLSKRSNKLSREIFESVLVTGLSHTGLNRGFVKKNNTIYTYSQLRTGLTYFYAKRKVCEDGVSTEPIDI